MNIEIILTLLIVSGCTTYILFHIKKVLTKGEENAKCADCPALEVMNQAKNRSSHIIK